MTTACVSRPRETHSRNLRMNCMNQELQMLAVKASGTVKLVVFRRLKNKISVIL